MDTHNINEKQSSAEKSQTLEECNHFLELQINTVDEIEPIFGRVGRISSQLESMRETPHDWFFAFQEIAQTTLGSFSDYKEQAESYKAIYTLLNTQDISVGELQERVEQFKNIHENLLFLLSSFNEFIEEGSRFLGQMRSKMDEKGLNNTEAFDLVNKLSSFLNSDLQEHIEQLQDIHPEITEQIKKIEHIITTTV